MGNIVPPHIEQQKVKAERTLLGALLRSPFELASHIRRIPAEAVKNSSFKPAMEAIISQFNERGQYSVSTVEMQARTSGLSSIAAQDPDVDLDFAITQWWNAYQVWAEYSAYAEASAADKDVNAMRERLEKSREELGAIAKPDEESYREAFANDAIAKLAGNERIYDTTPHLASVREVVKAFKPGTVTVVAGRPGMGKTQFALNTLSYFVDCGQNGLFFSLEMSAQDLLNRLLGIRHGINQDADWSTLKQDYVERAIHEVSTLKGHIHDKVFNIAEIESACAAAAYRGALQYVMIDYLQLVDSSEKSGNREAAISAISRRLVMISKRFNIPVIALSQLSRAVESRGGSKRPILSDLRESGAIEQDATIVTFLYRPEYYGILEDEFGMSMKGKAEVIIAKQRNGRTGSAICDFNPVRGFVDEKPALPIITTTPPIDFSSARPNIDEDLPF